MKLSQIKEILNGKCLSNEHRTEEVFSKIFACDLMSDVLALVDEEVILVTGLINIQTIRTAEMKDLKCVIFVRGKEPCKDVIELAKEKEMILITTSDTMFEACGKLYRAGLKGIEIYE